MNNSNIIKIRNENDRVLSYGEIPDLWHIAGYLESKGMTDSADAVREVWHMAHGFKAAIENQDGVAEIISAETGLFKKVEKSRHMTQAQWDKKCLDEGIAPVD